MCLFFQDDEKSMAASEVIEMSIMAARRVEDNLDFRDDEDEPSLSDTQTTRPPGTMLVLTLIVRLASSNTGGTTRVKSLHFMPGLKHCITFDSNF